MAFTNSLYDNKDKIGKILFSISILIFVYMFFSPSSRAYIHVDERFTVNLIKLPLADFFAKMIRDVHPPLYYFIIQFIGSIFSLINIPVDYFTISKMVSTLSYGMLLLVSGIKIRKDYGWIVAGIFTFIIGTMSGFFIQYTTSRMYGLATLLLILSFIYFKDVFFKSDKESWMLFIAFTILAAYTHYYLAFTIGFMYLILIANILKNKQDNIKNEIKKVIYAIIASIILYIPELYILTIQMSRQRSNGTLSRSIFDLLSFISMGNYQDTSLIMISIKIIAILLIIAIIIIAVKKYIKTPQKDETYILTGISLFLLTLIFGYLLLPGLIGALAAKYLLPAIGLFWLAASILIGKIENKKIFSLLVIIIILLSAIGMMYNIEESTKLANNGIESTEALKSINNENSVIIYKYGNVYHNCHNELNNTKEYALELTSIPYAHNVTIKNDIMRIINENPGKNVYIIQPNKKVKNLDDTIHTKIITKRPYNVIQLQK